MNENLKQIAVNAMVEHCVSHVRLQEFADLIIKQCAKIADTETNNSAGCGYITKTKGMLIKEHFGVAND
jgi:hypothetical protein